MIEANILHNMKKRRAYAKLCARQDCPFCNIDEKVLYKTPHLLVLKNAAPYDWFDNRGVKEHLLLIPKRHVEQLSDLTKTERQEYFDTLMKYEANGYSIFSRDSKNKTRSQPHLHTHFIKTGKHKASFMLIVRKLGLRIVK